ncbi:hypothetical protein ACCS60_34920, partial [Rhizobium acaciae]
QGIADHDGAAEQGRDESHEHLVVLNAFAIDYLATVAGLVFTKAFVGSMAFIPGYVIKAFVAALLGRAVMVGVFDQHG